MNILPILFIQNLFEGCDLLIQAWYLPFLLRNIIFQLADGFQFSELFGQFLMLQVEFASLLMKKLLQKLHFLLDLV